MNRILILSATLPVICAQVTPFCATATAATKDRPEMYLVRPDEEALKLIDKSTITISAAHRTATFHTYFGVLSDGSDIPHLAYTKEYDCAGKVKNLHLTAYKIDGSVAGEKSYPTSDSNWKNVELQSSDSDNEAAICHPLDPRKRLRLVSHQQVFLDYLNSLPH